MVEIGELERARNDNRVGFVSGKSACPGGKEFGYGASADKRENGYRGGSVLAAMINGF